MKKTHKHYHPLLGIVALIIIAGLAAWYVQRQARDIAVSDTTTSPNQLATVPDSQKPTPTPNGARLVVSTQKAGSTIDIDEVTLEQPGFVTIHAAEGGVPGKVVAKSGLISAGTKQDLVIRYTATPGTYYAMIHTDDGNGVFDAVADAVANSAPNTPLVVKFTVVK